MGAPHMLCIDSISVQDEVEEGLEALKFQLAHGGLQVATSGDDGKVHSEKSSLPRRQRETKLCELHDVSFTGPVYIGPGTDFPEGSM
jgi:hypothetical protein